MPLLARLRGGASMDVGEAVETRFSCRAFLDTPVPEATVREILQRAARAPSGGNVQPWRVYALAGEPLAELKRNIAGRPDELPFGEGAEYDIYPRPLKEPYETRRRAVGELLYRSIGIPRGPAWAHPAICPQLPVLRRAGRAVLHDRSQHGSAAM